MAVIFVAYAFLNRGTKMSIFIVIIGILMSITIFGYLFEIHSTTLENMIFWNRIQYFAIPFLPSVWLMIALIFTNHNSKFKGFWWLILIIPLITFFFVQTAEWNSLYYTSITTTVGTYFMYLNLSKGPWYFVQMSYGGLMILYAGFLYLRYLKTCTPGIKKVVKMLLLATLWPSIGLLLSLIPFPIEGIILASLFTPLSVIMFSFIIFDRYLLTLRPIAKEEFFLVANQGILVFDHNNILLECNPYTFEHFPILKDYINKPLNDIVKRYPKLIDVIGVGHFDAYEFEGNYYQTHLSRLYDRLGNSNGSIFTFINISENYKTIEELKINQVRVEYLSIHDQLTGLYNRHFLEEYMKKLSVDDYPIGIIYIDMNNLKSTNDSHGHLAGDALIKQTAVLITSTLDQSDLTVRIGGDEVLIFVPKTNEKVVLQKLKKLDEAAKNQGLSFALGHAIKNEMVAFDEVYRIAEDRMYVDKEAKKN
jgi:diguanylate cyclase (GGDEF)-like protein